MEPQGHPLLTPGTSYGPPSCDSAQSPDSPTPLNCTSKSSCSPNVSDGLMSAKDLWDDAGDEDPQQVEEAQPGADAGSPTRRFRSSAFHSSLSWDSDSERETLDEEELQHFSNPHGLAAHSPGSPSSGLRFDIEEDQEPNKKQHLHSKKDPATPEEGNTESTKTEEPNSSLLGPAELADSKVWNVSEGAELPLAKVKPKDGCQKNEEEDNSEGEGKDTKELKEKDVYSFPGDSDPESPPPAPWAHCTFIQRCRKKRVLFRPFSGLGTSKHTLLEPGKQAGMSPQKSKPAESAHLSQSGGVYAFEEVTFGEEASEEVIKFKDKGRTRDLEEETEVVPGEDIFTCVECSIYFRKQAHLQEHIVEHCESGAGGGRRLGKSVRFRCDECGWNLPNRSALDDHNRRHQESRTKIMEEIEKLNENGKVKEIQKHVGVKVKNISSDPTVMQDASKESILETSPPLSSEPVSIPEKDPAVLISDPTPPNSVRTPAQARAGPTCRRRFICTKCNFGARTSQALANHSKTHNRKKSPSRGSPSCSTSTSLACGHCAFLTSSPTVMRQHQKLVHSGGGSNSAEQAEETEQHSRSNVGAQITKPTLDSEGLSGSQPNSTQSKKSEESTTPEAVARPNSQVAFKCVGNRRFRIKRKIWTDSAKFISKPDDEKLPGGEDEGRNEDPSPELETESSRREAKSPVGVKPRTRARTNTDDSSDLQSVSSPLPPKKSLNDKGKPEAEKDGKVFFLRRRNRVPPPPPPPPPPPDIDSDDDDDDDDEIDEKTLRRFLSEDILGEDSDEDDADTLKSVERKCPYCPDRFHNGIGLANHVRGHLNRVGVSYNVRHFISPEEVNAIERKFSYQKKKKKVANFDPDTFSVMHCEFCSAGFDTRAGLSSHARAHLRDFGITNWDVTISPIHILRELFSSRPDLVIPTAPPRSPGSSLEEEEEEERKTDEDEGNIEVKLKRETSERTQSVNASDAQPSDSPPHIKEEERMEKCDGEEEEAAEDEEEEEQLQLPVVPGLSSSPVEARLCSTDTDSLSAGEDADDKVLSLKCEVCGVQCESRRRLYAHARSHLRQLAISFSESNGPPVDLLYQIAKERNAVSRTPSPPLEPFSTENSSPSVPPKDEDLEDMNLDQKPLPLSVLAKATKAVPPSSSTPTPSPGASPTLTHPGSPVVRKAPICSLLPVSSLLRSMEHKGGGMKSSTSNLSAQASIATTKPLWAPQENDAPLNLTLDVDPDKDIVCQLCGAWFETRKGLSSHARAHLRHFGVEYSESKGSPIDLLNQIIDTEGIKHKDGELKLDGPHGPLALTTNLSSPKQSSLLSLSSSSSSLLYKVTTVGSGSKSKATSSSASSVLGPPAKRHKSSSMRVFRLSNGELMALPHSEPPKEIGCEFCGEYFENRKGLSSHARSHLRQMGITEWSVNGSPIDTLRDIITRRGLPCALPLRPLKTPPPSSPGPPRSPLSTCSSPSASLLSRLPFAFARPSSPPQPALSKSNSAPPTSSSGLILKLKPEPVQMEVTSPEAVGRSEGFSGETLSWNSSSSVFPLNLAMTQEVEPTRDIRCEFCGEYFENRKGLSSHARSHLRQMGITEWSVNGSPIDTLREVMHKRTVGAFSQSDQGVKKESSQGAHSPPWENLSSTSSSERLGVSGYKSSKFRKSFNLLQSGLRLHKQGLGPVSTSAAPPVGKFFRMSPLAKRPLTEDAQSVEKGHSPPHQLKKFSPLPHDYSYKRKPSPDKHVNQDPSCELCGFFFENRKALASHARAHLRQFGVTEWSVNGSPIETLSAWMRSRPQKVLEMHRSYMQGSRSSVKKKASSSSCQWPSSLAGSPARSLSCEVSHGPSKAADCDGGSSLTVAPIRPIRSSPSLSRLSGGLSLQAQVARSELNVRLPRGLERRPLKHPSCPDGAERNSHSPKPPRTGTVPALVPKPPSYPLVKLVGKFYTLKCRFCEVEFHGPLSVQEDWIRHLQQHILKMNYNKPAAPKAASAGSPASAEDPAQIQASAPASTSTSSTDSTTPALTSTSTRSATPPPPAVCAPPVSVTDIEKVSEERPIPSPPSIALPAQTV